MKKMRNSTLLLSVVIALTFNACSSIGQFFSVGEEKSYCKEHGCDYSKVGVCAGPIEILENKNDLSVIKKREQLKRESR